MPCRCRRVDEAAEVVGRAEARRSARRSPSPGSPTSRERVLHHGHQLDVGEAQVGDVGAELGGELAVVSGRSPRAGSAATSRGAPRRSRSGRSGSRARARVEPRLVAPRHGSGRSTTEAVAGGTSALERERVGLRRAAVVRRGSRTCSGSRATPARTAPRCPTTPSERIGCSRPSQPLKSPTTRPLAFGAQTANAVPPPSSSRTWAPSGRRGARGGPRLKR